MAIRVLLAKALDIVRIRGTRHSRNDGWHRHDPGGFHPWPMPRLDEANDGLISKIGDGSDKKIKRDGPGDILVVPPDRQRSLTAPD